MNSVIEAAEGDTATYQVELVGSIERNVHFTIQTVVLNSGNLATSGE